MKKFTAMICAAAMSASMAITAVAAPSIGQLIPEAPEVVSGEIPTGYYLDVQNVDTTKYEEKAVADIVEKFNRDDTDPAYVPVSVADILEALKDYQPASLFFHIRIFHLYLLFSLPVSSYTFPGKIQANLSQFFKDTFKSLLSFSFPSAFQRFQKCIQPGQQQINLNVMHSSSLFQRLHLRRRAADAVHPASHKNRCQPLIDIEQLSNRHILCNCNRCHNHFLRFL